MPIKIPNNLPAAHILEGENIFVMDSDRAYSQDIRPLKILILNLMPIKYITETQLLRLLGNTPLQIEVDFIYTESYTPSHIAGVPDGVLRYVRRSPPQEVRRHDHHGRAGRDDAIRKEVAYWDEISEIMEWSKTHVYSTFHICWGAQAGLYYHYGIPKYQVPEKIFGVYKHHLCVEHEKLFRGFDDEFYVPHSRHTENHREDIEKVPELTILAEAEGDAGAYAIANLKKRQFFITGHAEYDPLTLKQEYDRDEKAGMNPKIPQNYYPDDDPTKKPVVRWRSVAHLLFANWLNYYVYQETPYVLDELYKEEDD